MGGEAAAEGGSGGGQVATVVLRASTDNLLDDLERAIDDGVNAYKVGYEMFGPNNHLSGFRREPADNMLSARAIDGGVNAYKVCQKNAK